MQVLVSHLLPNLLIWRMFQPETGWLQGFSGVPQNFLRTPRAWRCSLAPMRCVVNAGLAAAVGFLLFAWPEGAAAQGSEFNLSCGDREVLVGIRARQGWWMNGIAARCRTVEANGALGAAVRTTDYRGGAGGVLKTIDCAPSEVVVGFSGSQGDNGYVLHVQELTCAPWQARTRTAGKSTRPVRAFEPRPGASGPLGDACADGRVGTRVRGRAGAYLNRLSDLGCSYLAGADPGSRPAA